jgi:hypothetical protein
MDAIRHIESQRAEFQQKLSSRPYPRPTQG